jgi:hypothetical protein
MRSRVEATCLARLRMSRNNVPIYRQKTILLRFGTLLKLLLCNGQANAQVTIYIDIDMRTVAISSGISFDYYSLVEFFGK